VDLRYREPTHGENFSLPINGRRAIQAFSRPGLNIPTSEKRRIVRPCGSNGRGILLAPLPDQATCWPTRDGFEASGLRDFLAPIQNGLFAWGQSWLFW
jgi:hypothetical protein